MAPAPREHNIALALPIDIDLSLTDKDASFVAAHERTLGALERLRDTGLITDRLLEKLGVAAQTLCREDAAAVDGTPFQTLERLSNMMCGKGNEVKPRPANENSAGPSKATCPTDENRPAAQSQTQIPGDEVISLVKQGHGPHSGSLVRPHVVPEPVSPRRRRPGRELPRITLGDLQGASATPAQKRGDSKLPYPPPQRPVLAQREMPVEPRNIAMSPSLLRIQVNPLAGLAPEETGEEDAAEEETQGPWGNRESNPERPQGSRRDEAKVVEAKAKVVEVPACEARAPAGPEPQESSSAGEEPQRRHRPRRGGLATGDRTEALQAVMQARRRRSSELEIEPKPFRRVAPPTWVQERRPSRGAEQGAGASAHRAQPVEVGRGLMFEGDMVDAPAAEGLDERPSLPGSPRWTEGMNPGHQPDGPFAKQMRALFRHKMSGLLHGVGAGRRTQLEVEVDRKKIQHLQRLWAMGN